MNVKRVRGRKFHFSGNGLGLYINLGDRNYFTTLNHNIYLGRLAQFKDDQKAIDSAKRLNGIASEQLQWQKVPSNDGAIHPTIEIARPYIENTVQFTQNIIHVLGGN